MKSRDHSDRILRRIAEEIEEQIDCTACANCRVAAAERSGEIVRSSGNIFTGPGFADAGERQTKVRLAMAINGVLHRRGLSQGKAAALLGVNQPKVSALSKYRLEGLSVERLMRFLTSLNQDVEIVIRNRPRARRPGRVFVTAA
jgi:predicted XRE-type DNA-binding protein